MDRGTLRFRMLAEGTLIVGSILLAFAIQAWWEKTQEEARVEIALTNLEGALTESLPLLAFQVERLENRKAVLVGFLSRQPEELETVPVDSVIQIIGEVFRPRISGLNSQEVLSLLDDGALSRVSDLNYRSAAASWRALWQNIRDRQENLLQHQAEAVQVLAQDPLIRAAIPGYEGVAPITRNTLVAARENEAVVAMAASKLWYWNLLQGMYPDLAENAEDLVSAIEALR